MARRSSPVVKCVALPFGFRIRTPSKVVPSTFEPLWLAAFEVLLAPTFEVFLAELVTFKAEDFDDLVIEETIWAALGEDKDIVSSRHQPPESRIRLDETIGRNLEQGLIGNRRRFVPVGRFAASLVALRQLDQ